MTQTQQAELEDYATSRGIDMLSVFDSADLEEIAFEDAKAKVDEFPRAARKPNRDEENYRRGLQMIFKKTFPYD